MNRVILHCPVLQQQRSLEECVANCTRTSNVRHKCSIYYKTIRHREKEVSYAQKEKDGRLTVYAITATAIFPVEMDKKSRSAQSKYIKKVFGGRVFRGRVVFHYTALPHEFALTDLEKARKKGRRVLLAGPNGWVTVPNTYSTEYDEAFRLEWKLEKEE